MREEKPLFRGWRSFFWPIARSETGKFVPMLLIFFLIAFNYNILRIFKDSLVVTARDSGAEAIPFIKVWGILPAAIACTFLFTRLSNRYSRERVFYIMMGIFLAFFFIFAFFLYPARDALHPHAAADTLQTLLPSGFKGLIALFRNWTFTLFYIMSELWSSAILTVLFWGFANEVTTVQEARRFYGLFATGGNLSAILAGAAAGFLSGEFFIPWLPYGHAPWEQSILWLNSLVIGSGLLTLALYRRLHRKGLLPKRESASAETPRPKMSIRDSLSYLARSRYLILIALIVLAYNLSINLIEVVWKDRIRELYPDPALFNACMSRIMTATGVFAVLASLFMTNPIIRRFSWTTAAMIPAAIMAGTGSLFFFFTAFSESPLALFGLYLGWTPLFLSVVFGALQNSLTRASKYTLFDATKELAFIPLDSETKLKGKAAIDGVGSRLGKSGGSAIHQGLLLLFGSVSASAPLAALAFLSVAGVWVASVALLGKRFDRLAKSSPRMQHGTI